MSLDAWTLGVDGVLPWQTVGSGDSWKTADDLSLFYPARGTDGPLPSVRLKAFRRGQQDVEYLTLLQTVAHEPRWAIAGLLHDADYDRWPEEHPRLIVAWLREQGEPEIAQAVVAHFNPSEIPELTTLDKALLACDELAGFVMACCLVRPDGIGSLAPSSVKKKLKDKSFAAKVKRDDIYQGAERLGVNLDEHIQLVIDALAPHAEALGIGGTQGS